MSLAGQYVTPDLLEKFSPEGRELFGHRSTWGALGYKVIEIEGVPYIVYADGHIEEY